MKLYKLCTALEEHIRDLLVVDVSLTDVEKEFNLDKALKYCFELLRAGSDLGLAVSDCSEIFALQHSYKADAITTHLGKYLKEAERYRVEIDKIDALALYRNALMYYYVDVLLQHKRQLKRYKWFTDKMYLFKALHEDVLIDQAYVSQYLIDLHTFFNLRTDDCLDMLYEKYRKHDLDELTHIVSQIIRPLFSVEL